MELNLSYCQTIIREPPTIIRQSLLLPFFFTCSFGHTLDIH
uniref:Uncharacterized protein n=1 Tax=Arundo donax TaxID=35708 RepID=A0A0A9EH06_ARUDO